MFPAQIVVCNTLLGVFLSFSDSAKIVMWVYVLALSALICSLGMESPNSIRNCARDVAVTAIIMWSLGASILTNYIGVLESSILFVVLLRTQIYSNDICLQNF